MIKITNKFIFYGLCILLLVTNLSIILVSILLAVDYDVDHLINEDGLTLYLMFIILAPFQSLVYLKFMQIVVIDEKGIKAYSLLGLIYKYHWNEIKEIRIEYYISSGYAISPFFHVVGTDIEKHQKNGFIADDSNITFRYDKKTHDLIIKHFPQVIEESKNGDMNRLQKKAKKLADFRIGEFIVKNLIVVFVTILEVVLFTIIFKQENFSLTERIAILVILYIVIFITLFIAVKYVNKFIYIYEDQIILKNFISKNIVIDKKDIESISLTEKYFIIKSQKSQKFTFRDKKINSNEIKIKANHKNKEILEEFGYF